MDCCFYVIEWALDLCRKFALSKRPGPLLSFLFILPFCNSEAEVCRSTKYSQLVLDVEIMRNAEAFLAETSKKYRITINESYRTSAEQAARRKQAREGKGNPVATGVSRHEVGFAFDLNGLKDLSFNDWNNLLKAGEKYGFYYLLGDFEEPGNRLDWPHFSADPVDFGKTLTEALIENRVEPKSVADCPWKSAKLQEDLDNRFIVIHNVHVQRERQHSRDVVYLQAFLQNNGTTAVSVVEVRCEIRDSLGEPQAVRFGHPVGLRAPPLLPGEIRENSISSRAHFSSRR